MCILQKDAKAACDHCIKVAKENGVKLAVNG